MYLIENYKDSIRFNRQYEEISKFLQIVADNGYNEHFHWGVLYVEYGKKTENHGK